MLFARCHSLAGYDLKIIAKWMEKQRHLATEPALITDPLACIQTGLEKTLLPLWKQHGLPIVLNEDNAMLHHHMNMLQADYNLNAKFIWHSEITTALKGFAHWYRGLTHPVIWGGVDKAAASFLVLEPLSIKITRCGQQLSAVYYLSQDNCWQQSWYQQARKIWKKQLQKTGKLPKPYVLHDCLNDVGVSALPLLLTLARENNRPVVELTGGARCLMWQNLQ